MSLLNKYNFSPLVVMRTPAYAYSDYNNCDAALSHLLKDHFFRYAIMLASSSVYASLEHADFDYDKLDCKIKLTLRKYYNRMSLRCTPFGLFAGVSTARWGERPSLLFDDQPYPKIIYSFEHILASSKKYLRSPLKYLIMLKVNDTLYSVKDTFRFLRFELPRENTFKRVFYLQEVKTTSALRAIMDYSQNSRSMADLARFVSDSFHTDRDESMNFVDELVALQLLLPELQPNVIDKAYLDTLSAGQINSGLYLPRSNDPAHSKGEWQGQAGTEGECLKPETCGKSKYYAHLNFKSAGNILDSKIQQQITEALFCLNRLVPAIQPAGLQKFADAFGEKFDRQAVPLLEAVDPEIGVGYQGMASVPASSYLLQNMTIAAKANAGHSLEWTPVHNLLLKKMQERDKTDSAGIIYITPGDLEHLPVSGVTDAHPNSTSVIFRIMKDALYIESAGGVTATALLARFSLFDDNIRQHCRDIALLTQQANPDVLFAEINHFCDGHTANIARKKQIWDWEIPILCSSSLPENRQLPLSDLYIKMVDGRIILWSERLQKAVIPVLTSAYNYTHNDLAVFRLLCDLQH
ncbi:MAG: lantibiotic dehydratase family protein, partial [Bacteroidetes bacterium]|nr:lantibiotic dehydratase family protein [Bacteroidota bacterium]